jgi:CRP-like cAMP-binding protein
MYESLRKYINNITSAIISDEEFRHIEDAFTSKTVKKKKYLLHAGTVCKYMSFITKGAMRQYSIDEKGNEHVICFGLEGWWISDRGSFTNLIPSQYYIDAIEDTDLLVTTNEKINILIDLSPSFLKMSRILDGNNFVASQKRINTAISATAEEKVVYLMETYPEFLTRLPQNMVASYLGITPETMSRVRKLVLSRS